jgi:hypothetical protein
MKKTMLLAVLTCFLIAGAKAQLANTKYKGTIQMDAPTEIVWSFEKDTVRVYKLADNAMIETFTYKLDHDVLTLTKAYGISPCDVSMVGKYQTAWKDDTLELTVIEDACTGRADAIAGIAYTKMKK